jgi:hypothetical protein
MIGSLHVFTFASLQFGRLRCRYFISVDGEDNITLAVEMSSLDMPHIISLVIFRRGVRDVILSLVVVYYSIHVYIYLGIPCLLYLIMYTCT